MTPAALAGDVVALLDHLGVARVHVLGDSIGAAVALLLAVSHPDRVRSIVAASASVRPEGLHEDLTDFTPASPHRRCSCSATGISPPWSTRR